MVDSIDVLAFGAHADDVEIGMGGSIAKWAAEGKKVVICDLTEAELSSNGDVESRKREAAKSAEILGVAERVTLDIPDRGLYLTAENIRKVVEVIRKYRPALVFAPFSKDRHPDHGNCGALVGEAFFSAAIRKYELPSGRGPHRPEKLFRYFINGHAEPDFAVDISGTIGKKIESLAAYETQFSPGESGVSTPLTEEYISGIKARERLFGKDAGVLYAEGFKSNQVLLLDQDLFGGKL